MGKVGFISLLIAAIAVFLGERIANLRKRFQATQELETNHLPNCVFLPNLNHGSEDITILRNGLAFISSGLRYPGMPILDTVVGKIYVLDFNETRIKPIELRMPRNFDLESFNPHGISVYTDPNDGTVYLFVVSHPEHKTQIERFKFVEEDYSLVHLKTIKHELLHSVNDIVAVGVESFYATIDQYFVNEFMKGIVELILLQPWTTVVYYSPEEVKVVSDGYYFANGINVSPDQKYVYVADMADHNVHVLERKEDNGLAFVKSVAVGSLCDNLEVDPNTGDVWSGCHPNAWKLFFYDANNTPGSEVIQIQNILSDEPVVKQVYADDGKVLQGSSVATPYGNKLLIGTVFHKALICDLK
ncbi:serum paraoxonase/arylesterase 2-like [Boleophthalmus pectinirostris]|uniref:serum paraoxonase/arylesterase 2-like n=1 Tax=Boleophthalmus pectinirostris TaxID=150288 RepID=UPI00242EF4C4|nr:serum paraoxonase/arylesterase 2-like [Boleophthalmus pectinirostris]